MTKKIHRVTEAGFTIVELMIALSVLSTILVLSTIIMIQIGALYSKGVNAANLQNVSRNILSDMTSAMQFGGGAPDKQDPADVIYADSDGSHAAKVGAYCINSTRYSYVLDREQGTDINSHYTPHVLYRDTLTAAAPCAPLDLRHDSIPADTADNDPTANGYDMAADHMRLTNLSLIETPHGSGVYDLALNMAYGDSDLIDPTTHLCLNGHGQQYCSSSQLTTSVTRRIE